MRAHATADDARGMNAEPEPALFEIHLRGHLGDTLLGAFPGLRAERCGGDTLLTGPLPDQAALHGVLGQVEALGLELLEVRRQPS